MSLADFFESRPLSRIRRKQRFPTHDLRALRLKERAKFRRKKRRAVRASIEFQKKPPARFEESRAYIVDEEFPISLCPLQPFTVFAPREPMETHAMRGHEVEFLGEIWQKCLRIDPRDDTADAEELGRPAEKRLVIGIEP